MTPDAPAYRLRTVTEADRPFIARVFGEGRATEYARWGLDPMQLEQLVQHQSAAQWLHYQVHYPGAIHSVIGVGEAEVGRLWVHRDAGQLHLLDLTVLTAWRGRGIGGRIVSDLKAEAAACAGGIGIWLSDSEDASWWQRRGFRPCERRDFHQRWEWTPVGDQAPVGIR